MWSAVRQENIVPRRRVRHGGEIMWKCTFCDKTNFDDQKVCPYCNAPNPAQEKPASVSAPKQQFQPQSGATPPVQDWASRYNPDPKNQKKPVKIDQILKYMVIAASALLIIYLMTLLLQKPASKTDAAISPSPDQALSALKQYDTSSLEEATPAPTDTPAPTREPVVADAVVEVYLDFGETYQCSTKDFVLPYDIANDEVTWRCADNDAGTVCSKQGLIEASYYQVDPELQYNEEVIVTGTTKEGSVLNYHVYTGDGTTYTFNWSNSARSMRGYISGYTIVADKMIPLCSGFSMYYSYDLTHGKLKANAWSVWVREGGTTWVRVQDINITDPSGEVYNISFDHPISFNEIWIMPETYSEEFTFSSSFYVGYLLFE